MARAARTTKVTPRAAAATKARKLPAHAVTAKNAARKGAAAKVRNVPPKSTRSAAISSRQMVAPPMLPKLKVSKDDLRAQVAKLEDTVATLRAKSRELTRAAKQAAARIAELETQLATQTVPNTVPEQSARTVRGSRAAAGSRKRPIDPGDAVPPGVAVIEPQPLDEEARAAKDALTSHLSGT